MTRPGIDLPALAAGLAAAPPRPSSDYDLNRDVVLPEGRKLRPAAVLIGVQAGQVVLTKRASHLTHHPGQIAFPGGKQDPSDADARAAALREAREEIGLDPGAARIEAHLPPHETVTGFRVTPVLAEIDPDFVARADPAEVDEVFRVPLDFLMQPGNYAIERRRWRGQWRRYYVVPFGPYYIWGATARMLKALADVAAR